VRLARRMRLAVPAAAVLGLTLFTASMAWQVPAASAASGPLDAQSSELVRLINGARSAYGKSALRVDTLLASKARDGAIPCPTTRLRTSPAGLRTSPPSATCHTTCATATPAGTSSPRRCSSTCCSRPGATAASVRLTSTTAIRQRRLPLLGRRDIEDLADVDLLHYRPRDARLEVVEQPLEHHHRLLRSRRCGGWASGSTYYYDCVFAKAGRAQRSPADDLAVRQSAPNPEADSGADSQADREADDGAGDTTRFASDGVRQLLSGDRQFSRGSEHRTERLAFGHRRRSSRRWLIG